MTLGENWAKASKTNSRFSKFRAINERPRAGISRDLRIVTVSYRYRTRYRLPLSVQLSLCKINRSSSREPNGGNTKSLKDAWMTIALEYIFFIALCAFTAHLKSQLLCIQIEITIHCLFVCFFFLCQITFFSEIAFWQRIYISWIKKWVFKILN